VSDYPSSLITKPLTTWPGTLTPWQDRKRSPFSAGMRQTLDLLDRELWYLNARATVLEVAIPPEKFRIDGHPRAGATAEHPGVVLSLPHTNVGPLRYACDRFDRWQDNLRAIALGLEALRKVERYGITRRGEQYAGFRALPPGGPIALSEGMDVDEAARVLREGDDNLEADVDANGRGWEHTIKVNAEFRNIVYRRAAKRHHPDVGGQRHTWDRIELAKRVLDGAGS
jgi:hypothetical protein